MKTINNQGQLETKKLIETTPVEIINQITSVASSVNKVLKNDLSPLEISIINMIEQRVVFERFNNQFSNFINGNYESMQKLAV